MRQRCSEKEMVKAMSIFYTVRLMEFDPKTKYGELGGNN